MDLASTAFMPVWEIWAKKLMSWDIDGQREERRMGRPMSACFLRCTLDGLLLQSVMSASKGPYEVDNRGVFIEFLVSGCNCEHCILNFPRVGTA